MDINIKDILKTMFQELRIANPSIPTADFENVLTEVGKRIDNEPPPRIALIGESGVGKSTTLNSLFNAGQDVSHTEACTQIETAINITLEKIEGGGGALVVYDMPGLSESMASRASHISAYSRVLRDVDVALWVLDAQYRPMEAVQNYLIHEIRDMSPHLVDRMVFALNKVDLVYPGERAWHPLANLPSEEQEKNILSRIADVEKKIKEAVPSWKGQVIGYSAEKRYNLPQLFSVMLEAVPQKRQWVVASRKALADFLELVNPDLLPDNRKLNRQLSAGGDKNTSELDEEMSDAKFAEITKNKTSLLKYLRNKISQSKRQEGKNGHNN
jgi:uncharacterized protein